MKNRTLFISALVIGVTLYWVSTLPKRKKKPAKNESLRKSQAENYFAQIEGILAAARRTDRSLSTAEMQQVDYLKGKLLELGFEYIIPGQEGVSSVSRQWAVQYHPN